MKEIILEISTKKEISDEEALDVAMQGIKDAMLETFKENGVELFQVDVKGILNNMINDENSLVKIKDTTKERLFGISEVASALLEEYQDIENESTFKIMKMLGSIFE